MLHIRQKDKLFLINNHLISWVFRSSCSKAIWQFLICSSVFSHKQTQTCRKHPKFVCMVFGHDGEKAHEFIWCLRVGISGRRTNEKPSYGFEHDDRKPYEFICLLVLLNISLNSPVTLLAPRLHSVTFRGLGHVQTQDSQAH